MSATTVYGMELTWAIYGITYVVLGACVAARAAAFPPSTMRNRLFALAAFGTLHAFFEWWFLANHVTNNLIPKTAAITVEAASFLPLYYFALLGRVRITILHAVAAATVCVFIAAATTNDVGLIEFVTRLAIGLPAGCLAAIAFARDPAFRVKPVSSDWLLRLAAWSLGAYAATQVISAPGDFFPVTVFNQDTFFAVFGFSLFPIRTGLAAVFMAATLMLLQRFDAAMRQEREELAKHADAALRVSRARLTDIFRMSPEGIVITGTDGRIAMFSAGAEAMFNRREKEMIGREIDCLVSPQERSFATYAASRQVNAPVERIETVGLRKGGEEFPMEASLSKLAITGGVTTTLILRDVSAQKAVYEELVQAKVRAEEASQVKSRFIANMSHELRTPLNAILGFSELLSTGGFREKSEEFGKLIHHSGQHLLTLINDILDLAKIESGRFTLNEAVLDMGELAAFCLEMMESKALAGGVTLAAQLGDGPQKIRADERALKQILLNLLSNAIKFTRAGGGITLFAHKIDTGEFAFGVRDTGVGITDEDQPFIFDRFGQGRHDAVTADRGTGLGLPIVKGLAAAHGGCVELESRVGVGTTVTVYLPAERMLPSDASKAA